jgi:hypothetical protein
MSLKVKDKKLWGKPKLKVLDIAANTLNTENPGDGDGGVFAS